MPVQAQFPMEARQEVILLNKLGRSGHSPDRALTPDELISDFL